MIAGCGLQPFLFILLLIARLIYRNTGGRLLAYRIIMGVEYVFLSLLILLLFSMMTGSLTSIVYLLPLKNRSSKAGGETGGD